MDAKTLKEKLSDENIYALMEHLGADKINGSRSNEVLFKTICHCGDSHKLYYYKDSMSFHCYSNCGQMDIITIVQKVMDINIGKAISFICNFVGISNYSMNEGFETGNEINQDWEIFALYESTHKEVDMNRNFKNIDDSILNEFYQLFHPAFYEDGITIETMKKFGIRYDILNQRIIIPHWDENGDLIAVRSRNTIESIIAEGMKYVPIVYKGKLLSAPTGKYLYGLNFNKENIKRSKKVILVESEKAVMQLDSILTDNISVALSSSNLSLVQVELLKQLGVEEVIIALDKEFKEYGSKEEKLYAMKIRKSIISKLIGMFNISIVWDKEGLIGFKESPSDRGSDVFWKLMNSRIEL